MSLEDLGDLWDYLVDNPYMDLCGGGGFFLKEDAPEKKIDQLVKRHTKCLKGGEPYFIFNILAHDMERGAKIIRKGFWYYLADPDSYSFE